MIGFLRLKASILQISLKLRSYTPYFRQKYHELGIDNSPPPKLSIFNGLSFDLTEAMIYTIKGLINLHKCSIFKLDALVYLDEEMIINIGEETSAMITTNRSSDFSHGIVSKNSLEFYDRTLEELNNEDDNFVIDRVHPDTAEKLIPALLKFYS